ncbi:FG-GAP repeat domain-containing protein [Lysobacter fragariae]
MASVPNLQWQVAGIGDFDGDGGADVLWRNLVTGANAIWKSALASSQQGISSVANLDWVVAGIGDFDGDGKSDVFWRNTATGANVIWRSASAPLQRREATVASASWQVAAVGDFDGNGSSDVFWHNLDTGGDVIWWNGNAAMAVATTGVGDPTWQIAATGDFDGDGHDDVLWRNFYTGAGTIWPAGLPASRRSIAPVTNLDWAILPFEAQPTAPLLSIAASTAFAEGNVGSRQVPLPLRLSHRSVLPVLAGLDIYDKGECVSCASTGSDYAAANLPGLLIAPGRLRTVAPVTVYGDGMAEANEVFAAVVYAASGARMVHGTGFVTLLNDDANTVWIDDARSTEGNSGTHPMRFTLQLSRASGNNAGAHVATANLGGVLQATPGIDYVAKSVDIAIPVGATSATFDVVIVGDLVHEPIGESFDVVLSGVVGAIPLGNARGFIIDDEPPIIP